MRRKGYSMYTLTPEHMKELLELVESIRSMVGAHKEIEEKLDLNGKLNGTLGEAIGLTKLYSIYGSSADYNWRGKQRKGCDVLVTVKGKTPQRFQIKTSAQEKYMFRVIKVVNVDRDKVRLEREKGDFFEIAYRIEEAINNARTDVWLLIHAKKDNYDFYWIEKEDLIKIVTEHYTNAVTKRKHRENFNEYIDNNNVYSPILVQTAETDRCLLNKYNKPPCSD